MKSYLSNKLSDLGERNIKSEILKTLKGSEKLIDGYGHDASFLDLQVSEDEMLFINTDKSGLNVAYKLGLANAECVGEFGVSHSVSDVVASGGVPEAISVALMLPDDENIEFVKQVMQGVETATEGYGAVLTGGDTKKASSFSIVVTAIGKGNKKHRLTRSGAKDGDLLVTTGTLGDFFLGNIVFKQKIEVQPEEEQLLKSALIKQEPPVPFGMAMAREMLANACTDISDGLSGALHNICMSSGTGAIIDESLLPLNDGLCNVIRQVGLRPIQMTLAGGDWRYMYSIPPKNIKQVKALAEAYNERISIIGKVVKNTKPMIQTLEGKVFELKLVENDSFFRRKDNKGYFTYLAEGPNCFGAEIPVETSDKIDIGL